MIRWRIDKSIVPVLMFHSIGIKNDAWIWSSMTETCDIFENTLSALLGRGYATVGLEELHRYMSGSGSLPPGSIVLTFDDGYLDNWVFVAPLLRKYGMKGVVYVTPEFVQDSTVRRWSGEDVSRGSVAQEDLESIGFMNWAELRAVDTEGVLDVQCHALTHTWYFSEPVIVDVHRPRRVFPYPWLAWNERPERKSQYLNENQQNFVPWGHPVFRHEKSLIVKRFTPDQDLIQEICAFVEARGGEQFFHETDWRRVLENRFACFTGAAPFPGTIESDSEYRERVLHELVESKRRLETELNKDVHFLSWPGGGVNDDAASIARQAGYLSWTLSSWQKPALRNRPGMDPSGIKRISGRSKVHWRGRWIANGGASWIIRRLLAHRGSLANSLLAKLRKLGWIVGLGRAVRER